MACSSSDTRMHIEALALRHAIGAAEMAPKFLCRSLAIENRKRLFGKQRLRLKR